MGTVLVTGVSRRASIGFAIARRLLDRGDRVVVSSWAPHDAGQPWGGDDLAPVLATLGDPPHLSCDLADPAAPAALVSAARDAVGPLTTLVAAHARSARGGLADVDAAEVDLCFAVNARGSLLLTQALAAQYEPAAGPGSVVLFTSGQHRGPMADELPYAISKGAVQQMTASLADALIGAGITCNCVNPGPTDTGWAGPEQAELVARAMPRGRWNTADEAGRGGGLADRARRPLGHRADHRRRRWLPAVRSPCTRCIRIARAAARAMGTGPVHSGRAVRPGAGRTG